MHCHPELGIHRYRQTRILKLDKNWTNEQKKQKTLYKPFLTARNDIRMVNHKKGGGTKRERQVSQYSIDKILDAPLSLRCTDNRHNKPKKGKR
jgi:hypothetical protein